MKTLLEVGAATAAAVAAVAAAGAASEEAVVAAAAAFKEATVVAALRVELATEDAATVATEAVAALAAAAVRVALKAAAGAATEAIAVLAAVVAVVVAVDVSVAGTAPVTLMPKEIEAISTKVQVMVGAMGMEVEHHLAVEAPSRRKIRSAAVGSPAAASFLGARPTRTGRSGSAQLATVVRRGAASLSGAMGMQGRELDLELEADQTCMRHQIPVRATVTWHSFLLIPWILGSRIVTCLGTTVSATAKRPLCFERCAAKMSSA